MLYLAIASAACAGAIPTHFVKGGGGLSNAEGQRGRGCGKAAGSNDNAGGYQLGVGGVPLGVAARCGRKVKFAHAAIAGWASPRVRSWSPSRGKVGALIGRR